MHESQTPYRIPYQGSKQAIVARIYDLINIDVGNTRDLFSTCKIDTINDLFCGGGAVGYYFAQHGWNVVMNDINKPLIELHKVLQMPKDKTPLTHELLYKWIEREEFVELIERQDWYGALIRYCWSFGNNGCTYMFGKDIADYKKQGHLYCVDRIQIENIPDTALQSIKARRGFLNAFCKKEFEQIMSSDVKLKNDYAKYIEILKRDYTKEIVSDFCNWLRSTGIKAAAIDKITNLQMASHYLSNSSQQAIPTVEIFNQIKILLGDIIIPEWIQDLFCKNDTYKKKQIAKLGNVLRLQNLAQLQNLVLLENLARLQSVERLQNFQNFHSLQHITFTAQNYYEFDFSPNSILYADPPYVNTTGYGEQTFDFNQFDNWVRDMKSNGVRVYISEYTNHNNEWREVGSINKHALARGGLSIIKKEKVFCNI